MNVRELSKLTGLSGNTIRRVIKKVYPDKIRNGVAVELNNDEVVMVKDWLAINHQTLINVTSPNGKVTLPEPVKTSYLTKSDLKEFARDIVSETIKALIPLIQPQQPAQIQFTQDYFSILGYCNVNRIQLTFSEAIKFGKEAARLSREQNIEIREIPDERYGRVKSYKIDILNSVFEV